MGSSPASQRSTNPDSNATGLEGRFASIFNRVFSRHSMNMALLVMVPMLFASTLLVPKEMMRDPDIWWHLADARILCTTHHFIQSDSYSFTVAGQRWIDPEWLSELPYWLSYKVFNLSGIYLLAWLAIGANILFIYWRGYWKARHAGAAFWAAGVAFLLITVNSGPRMIAMAYLAMQAELAILEAAERGNKRLLWLLPPLFCLWVNLHGSWLIGLGLLALYILCGLVSVRTGALEQEALTRKDRERLLAVFSASVLALMANPYGWRLVWNPFDMMMNQRLNIASVTEWRPLNLSSIAGMAAALAISLLVIANCIRGRKWKIYELAFVLFAWYAAIDHMRFAFMAAVITIPMLAEDMARSFFLESDEKTIPAMNALIVAGALCMIVYLFPKEAAFERGVAEIYPLESIDLIQPDWRTLNWDNLGGRMAFQSKPNFIDSRFDIFEHHGVFGDYLNITNINDSLNILDRSKIDHVLIQESIPLSYLLQRTPGWQVQKREKTADSVFVLYRRTSNATDRPVIGAGDSAHPPIPLSR